MKNFVILGTQRTGSSALGEAIGTHPNVACGWEWTQRVSPLWLPRSTSNALLKQDFSSLDEKHQKHMHRLMQKDVSCLGYRRLFRSSATWIFDPGISPVVIERLGWHLKWFAEKEFYIIHIVRSDNMNWLKSKAFSKETGNYVGKKYADDVSASIDPHEALKRVQAKHWLDARLSTLEGKTHYIQIRYEEFLKDNQVDTQRVIDFLEEDVTLLPSLKETMALKPQSNKNLLKNHHEVETILRTHNLLSY